MTEKKALNEFISLLPMAAIIMDKKGTIVFANHIFKDKFKLSKLSKSNKIYLQNFFNFDITNIFNKLLESDTSVSTYDYKFIDLDENEITADLHFNTIQEHKILMILQEKDNFKTYLTQASKTFSDTFMNSLSNNLGKNISSPITNIIGAIDIINLDKSTNMHNELINIILEESNKIKDYLININQFNVNMSLDIEKANIHQCLTKLPIHIKIIDEGPGVEEDIEKFMFYPFITSKTSSEGLGLTYVNSVVSKYGGYFKYEREKGRSALNMVLPLVKNRSVNY